MKNGCSVCIIEDSSQDVIERYSSLLNASCVVNVVMISKIPERLMSPSLVEAGFDALNIKYGRNNIPDNADVYFCDGLMGDCFAIFEKYQDKNFYINSGDVAINEDALSRGINIVGDRDLATLLPE